MTSNKNTKEQIGSREIMIAIPSMVIAVAILNLPNTVAQDTRFSDGWIAIVLAGLLVVFLTWTIVKLCAKFPNQSFLSYASSLVTKPVAIILTVLFIIQGIVITAYEVRMITDISHEYLFESTPIEVIGISFFLVVIYAVSGSRVSIFRLNTLFLPIILIITLVLIFFAISYMETDHIVPVLTTEIKDYMRASMNTILAFTGFSILFFYMSLVKDPKKAPSRAALGMCLVIAVYLVLYLTSIAVFGEAATEVIRYPIIELAKSVEIPGGFSERMESFFFVIWITAIFTTTMMAFDYAVFALQSIFPKVKKTVFIFSLAPFIFFIAQLPDNYLEMLSIGKILGYLNLGYASFVAILLWSMYGIRGGKQNAK